MHQRDCLTMSSSSLFLVSHRLIASAYIPNKLGTKSGKHRLCYAEQPVDNPMQLA